MERKQKDDIEAGCGVYIRKSVVKGKWQNFKKGIYDSDTEKILGRTKRSWWQLGLFYTVFMVILLSIFALCMWTLFVTLNDKKPKYILEESIIGTSPGLGFRPMPEDLKEGSLIWYSLKNQKSIEKFTNILDDFLNPYTNQTASNLMNCDFEEYPKENKVCKVDMDKFGDCKSKLYGYDKGDPCIFIKLNRIFGWEPECYRTPQAGMPRDLNLTISKQPKWKRSQIWVSCAGQFPHDREAVNQFSYNPPGFAAYYYPYTNTMNYLSPLVAVKIHNPRRNVLINIECRAWAKNIIYHGGEVHRQGSVRFELMIDGPEDNNVARGLRKSANAISTEEF